MRPGVEPTSSRILVRFVAAEPQRELLCEVLFEGRVLLHIIWTWGTELLQAALVLRNSRPCWNILRRTWALFSPPHGNTTESRPPLYPLCSLLSFPSRHMVLLTGQGPGHGPRLLIPGLLHWQSVVSSASPEATIPPPEAKLGLQGACATRTLIILTDVTVFDTSYLSRPTSGPLHWLFLRLEYSFPRNPHGSFPPSFKPRLKQGLLLRSSRPPVPSSSSHRAVHPACHLPTKHTHTRTVCLPL